jgi:K+-transporting ATPase c subunit
MLQIALALLKTTVAVLALTVVYPNVVTAIAHALNAVR